MTALIPEGYVTLSDAFRQRVRDIRREFDGDIALQLPVVEIAEPSLEALARRLDFSLLKRQLRKGGPITCHVRCGSTEFRLKPNTVLSGLIGLALKVRARRNLNALDTSASVQTREGKLHPVPRSFWLTKDADRVFLRGEEASLKTAWLYTESTNNGLIVVSSQDAERIFAPFNPAEDELPGMVEVAASNGRPQYVPPYMEFMLRVAADLGLNESTRMPKAHLEERISEKWPANLGGHSKTLVSSMATLMRTPDDKHGGHFSPERSRPNASVAGSKDKRVRPNNKLK